LESNLNIYKVCLTNPASLKELIPEFYEENTDFLLNIMEIELGSTNNNEKVNVLDLLK
jgi:hypothetical protein